MAVDKTNKHKTKKHLPEGADPLGGLKLKTSGKSGHLKRLAKNPTKKDLVTIATKKSGKTSRKKIKKMLIAEGAVTPGLASTSKKSSKASAGDPALINWEPTVHILTGQHLIDFINGIYEGYPA
jgi:hypothetical protein